VNYIELINGFWSAHREERFSGNDIALYFYLLEVANSLGWKRDFKHANSFITGTLGISEKTLHGCRNRLQIAKLITFKAGNGRKEISTYTINPPKKVVKITPFREETLPPFGQEQGTLSGENSPARNKLNETKRNLKEGTPTPLEIDPLPEGVEEELRKAASDLKAETSKKEKKDSGEKKESLEIIYPWTTPAFIQAWSMWEAYRREIKQPAYKPIGLQGALNKLAKDADGQEQTAIAIINQSIASGWKGLFPLKDEPKNFRNHAGNQQKGFDGDRVVEEVRRQLGLDRKGY
jgi:hypothetical protein